MRLILPPVLVRADLPSDYDDRRAIVAAALAAGYTCIILRPEDSASIRLGRYTGIAVDGKYLTYSGEKIGAILPLAGSADMEEAYNIKDTVSYLVITPSDWKVIPLENLISRFQHSTTKVYVCVKTPEDAKLAFAAMGVGTDGVVITPENPEDISGFSQACETKLPCAALEMATVTKITPLSLGDRVCIDTCSLLVPGEGMLIGSQSSGLFFVCSESFKSEYVNSRPFRVNAGSVHSYLLCPDGTTCYLSEIAAGNQVLTRRPDGTLRSVSVGRVKIEMRPLLFIEAEADGRTYSVVLQNAETIRLGAPSGAVSIADLSVGSEVYVRLESGSRHFGHVMVGTICEK
ncbi:MAG: 3-dehydroquinate synthase II [Methanocalculaceae archaeon]|jgi:3-dehydroquinate synthase II|nr:3-dehydroquinate synthase II [Methanocalculaceae archaeon]